MLIAATAGLAIRTVFYFSQNNGPHLEARVAFAGQALDSIPTLDLQKKEVSEIKMVVSENLFYPYPMIVKKGVPVRID